MMNFPLHEDELVLNKWLHVVISLLFCGIYGLSPLFGPLH